MKRFNWISRVSGTVLLMATMGIANSAAQQPLNVMPLPANAQSGTGALTVDANFSVVLTGYTEARLDRSVQRFRKQLAGQTGLVLKPQQTAAAKGTEAATLTIRTAHASQAIQELGEDESYSLEITPSGAKLNAETPLGTMHGLQTFLQLVSCNSAGVRRARRQYPGQAKISRGAAR